MSKFLIIDTREKPKAIANILKTFDAAGIKYERSKLLFGDYMDWNRPEIVIDRKKNIAELAKNVTVELKRFTAELDRSFAAGAQLVILVEQNRYKYNGTWKYVETITDLMLWSDPHTSIQGEKVFRTLSALKYRYNIIVKFCDKRQTGKEILKIIYGLQ